jgi:hypothetical protein
LLLTQVKGQSHRLNKLEQENIALGTADYLGGGGAQYDMRNVQAVNSGYYASQSGLGLPTVTGQRFQSPGYLPSRNY